MLYMNWYYVAIVFQDEIIQYCKTAGKQRITFNGTPWIWALNMTPGDYHQMVVDNIIKFGGNPQDLWVYEWRTLVCHMDWINCHPYKKYRFVHMERRAEWHRFEHGQPIDMGDL